MTLFDVGGGPRIRGIWKNYYAQVHVCSGLSGVHYACEDFQRSTLTCTHTHIQSHGIIFVVDASSPERLDEVRQILSGVLQDERVMGKPLLIFANKQDREGALSVEEVSTHLELDTMLGEHRQNTQVVSFIS